MGDEMQNSTDAPNNSSNKRRRATCGYCGNVGHTRTTCPNYLFRGPYATLPQTQNSSNPPVIEPVAIVNQIDESGNEVNELDLEQDNPTNLPEEFVLDGDNGDDSGDDDVIDEMDDGLWTRFDVNEIAPGETGFPGNAIPSVNNDTSGKPRNIPPDTRSCCQFLDLLFTNEILEQFVEQTNAHAGMIGNTHALTIEELKKYFAITLYIGVCQIPCLRMLSKTGMFQSSWVQIKCYVW